MKIKEAIMENNILKHRTDDTISNISHCKISTSLPRPLLGNEVSTGIRKLWQMKRKKLTPSYTTNWKHIPVVKAI